MYDWEFYKRKNGQQPAETWMEKQDGSLRPTIGMRLTELRMLGTELAERKILVPIEPDGKEERINGLYELRHVAKQWRIAVYHCLKYDKFILLHGWNKGNYLQGIKKAKKLALEYLERKGIL